MWMLFRLGPAQGSAAYKKLLADIQAAKLTNARPVAATAHVSLPPRVAPKSRSGVPVRFLHSAANRPALIGNSGSNSSNGLNARGGLATLTRIRSPLIAADSRSIARSRSGSVLRPNA